MRNRKESAVVLEFIVEAEDFRRFQDFAAAHHLSQDDALRSVLIEGMKRFWPLQLAYMETDFTDLKKRFKDYSRDNEILGRIYSQNKELGRLLESAGTERKRK
jgi:hypothetical protein